MARRKTPPSPPSIVKQIAERLRAYQTLAISLMAIAAFFGAVWGGLVRVGLDPVGSGTLSEYKAEVARKMAESDDALRREFRIQLDTAVLAVTKDISGLQQEVFQRKRDLWRVQVENLEAQEAQIVWSQLPQINANLAGIEHQLRERQGDQFLLSRRAEVENAKKNIENRLATIQKNVKSLRETPP